MTAITAFCLPARPEGEKRSWRWDGAYLSTLFIPLMLIVSRGPADMLFTLTGALFVWRSIEQKDWAWTRDPFVRAAGLTWLWLLIIIPFGIDTMESLTGALGWIRFPLFFAALRHWVLTRSEAIKIAGYALTLLLMLVVADTLWQYVFGTSLSGHVAREDRLTGPMSSVKVGIYMAKLLLPAAGISLYFALRGQHRLLAAGLIGFLLICEMTILLSGERTAFFSSMLGIITIVLLLSLSEKRMRLAALGLLAVLIMGAVALASTQEMMVSRATRLQDNLTQFHKSAYGQLLYAASEIGQQHWLMGTGLKGFRLLCPELLASHTVDYCDLHPHNIYLEWFVETGVIGFALFAAMVLSLVTAGFKRFLAAGGVNRLLAGAALSTLVVHFFPLMVTQSIFSNWPAILLWYSLALAFSGLNALPPNGKTARG